ncbi:MAG: ATP-dependent DNA helicase [Lachnospiraceae bacterium]|nr:ATP-dependent DNA helicase [Lachnospiraceae bacterium]
MKKNFSDIFLQLHISERSGRGVPLITKVYGQEAFEFRENSIVVTIPFTFFSTNDREKVGDKVGDKSAVRLNPTRQRIVEEMRNNPNVTLPQLTSMIGLSYKTIEKNVSYLKKNKIIDRVGSNKNGWWRVL